MPSDSGAEAKKDTLTDGEALVSDAVGRLIEAWGFKRHMGRIWAILYLSDGPLTAKDLRARLGLSTGSVSMTLRDLQHWGVVKKVWIQGERQDHFVAESNLWKMVSRVLAERERVEVQELIDTLERAVILLKKREKREAGAAREATRSQTVRVERLLDLAKLGRSLLDALIHKARVDATPLVKFLLGDRAGDATR
ncbi:MAG: MarR family transcriptional regulator [Myxococcota bacterium]